MTKQWITIAPNGENVTLNGGGPFDSTFQHNQIMNNEVLAKAFPQVFHKFSSGEREILREVPKVEKVEKVPEKVEEPVQKPQLLEEVPPRTDLGDVIEASAQTKEVQEEVEVSADGPKKRGRPWGAKGKAKK